MYALAQDLLESQELQGESSNSAKDAILSNYAYCSIKTGDLDMALNLFKKIQNFTLVDRLGMTQVS